MRHSQLHMWLVWLVWEGAHHVHKEPQSWMKRFTLGCWHLGLPIRLLDVGCQFPRQASRHQRSQACICFFWGGTSGLSCTSSSGARYFKQHQCATCTMNPQVVQLCASLINRLRIEVRAASESKLMLGEKRERETQIVFTFDPAGKHAWQTLSQLCLLSATCVLGEHLGWPCWPFHSAFLARWRHRTLFSCSSSLRG